MNIYELLDELIDDQYCDLNSDLIEENYITQLDLDTDKRIFIPMAGEIESLNAAVAAAILMFR